MFIMLGIAYILGLLKLTIISFFIMAPYRIFSGGFHLKTHIGCIISTSLMYTGTAFISKFILLSQMNKSILICFTLAFGIISCILYAPADTENVPILRKKERKLKKIGSCIILSIMIGLSIFIRNEIISNILLIGALVQTLTIIPIAYRLTNNKYGHQVYENL